ncbi:MAG: carbohydrate ABC transporter permease [Spirochaetia bacterium]|nr:carbohydrate ABC transporter permease [Spirochaetia bacterium]
MTIKKTAQRGPINTDTDREGARRITGHRKNPMMHQLKHQLQPRMRIEYLKTFLLLLLALIIILPLALLFSSSLKDDRYQITAELGSLKAFFVPNPSFNNYIEILGPKAPVPMARFFLNSCIVMAGTVVGTLVVSTMTAYALLRGKFRFKRIIMTGIIALYIIPAEAIMLPLLFLSVKIHLSDTYIIQMLPFMASPIYIFLFHQFFKEIPASIAESAQIEGASFWKIFHLVFVPLNVPALVTVTILQGMESWNQYLWPLLVVRSENVRPMTVAIASFFSTSDIYWDRLFAASVVMMMPILVLYLAFQKYFIASIASSAVKG